MAKNFVDEGTGVPYKNAGNAIIYSGSVVAMDALVGIALADIPAGASGTLRIVGVWKLPKDTATAMAVGDVAFWDTANKKIVAAAGTDIVAAGVVAADATAGAGNVNIKINA